ncbi:MAG: hypothetical protein L3J74_10040 [Bacteroidales bacterium]|nr:hypothetical protein [Bacteroidales bacterium]
MIFEKINWKKIILWFVAIVITLAAAVYQRLTGPTYPKRIKVELNDKEYRLELIRSHGGTSDAAVVLPIEESGIAAVLHYKFYPEHKNEEWKNVEFKHEASNLIAYLPNQPMAGKLMYYITLKTDNESIDLEKESPVVIRFKGEVPKYVLFPHIFFMFFAMLLANVAGLYALWKIPEYKRYTLITFVFIIIGGLILGPFVQKFAFDEFWTGIPWGWDLTDNKTLFAFTFWLIAVLGNRKENSRPYLTVIAAIAILLIFSIPHSMFGSELDRTTGTVTQGFIEIVPMIKNLFMF